MKRLSFTVKMGLFFKISLMVLALLIIAIQGADIPLVQTLVFIFAILIVGFNILVDMLYGVLDPRIRYD